MDSEGRTGSSHLARQVVRRAFRAEKRTLCRYACCTTTPECSPVIPSGWIRYRSFVRPSSVTLESQVGRVEGVQTSSMLVDEHQHGQRRAVVVGDVTTIPLANDVKAVTDVVHQGHPLNSSFQMPLLLQQVRFTRSIGGFLHRLSHKLNSSTALRHRGCALVSAMFLIGPGSRFDSGSCE